MFLNDEALFNYYEQNQQKPQNYDETMDKLSEDTNRLQIPVNVD